MQCCAVLSHSVVSDSLQLLCPWGFSRQKHWGGLPSPPPGDLLNPEIEPRSPVLQVELYPLSHPGKPKNTGVGSLSLSQGLFPTQESTWGLLPCKVDSLPAELPGKPTHYATTIPKDIRHVPASGTLLIPFAWEALPPAPPTSLRSLLNVILAVRSSLITLFKIALNSYVCVCAKLLRSCPTLCDSLDSCLPGFSVHGVLQARILQWVAIPSSRGSSPPRDQTCISYVSCIGRQVLYSASPGKP